MRNNAEPTANFPFLIGVYMVLNAIPDAFLFLDGPDCVTFKAEYLQGKHDLNSHLLNASGPDRIRHCMVDATSIVHDRTQEITDIIRSMDALPEATLIFYTSMPMATITGTQYDMILRGLVPPLKKPLIGIPPLSLQGDWLDGFAHALESLATQLPQPDQGIVKNTVAVVGYPMDRTESNHTANVRQIETMLRTLALEPVSIWPSNRPVEHLTQVFSAEFIISMPHARKAAAVIAQRTGAQIIQTGIPLGLAPTCQWIRSIAEATGKESAAESYIDQALSSAVPRLQWLVEKVFQNARTIFGGDPLFFPSIHEFFTELGCSLVGFVGCGSEKHLSPLPAAIVAKNTPILFDATPREISELAQSTKPLDFIFCNDTVANFAGIRNDACSIIPFGYPTHFHHAIADTPTMGFSGALTIAERIANQILQTHGDFR